MSAMDAMMALRPSEYEGQAATCVYGRVVLRRGPFPIDRSGDVRPSVGEPKGRGKAGGKSKRGGRGVAPATADGSVKAEVHFLGGDSVDEILFMEGWADAAQQLLANVERGRVYRICGAKKIDSAPRYSTSRLSYFLRVIPPIGVNTRIEVWEGSPTVDIPLHHPFTDFAKLQKVETSLRVSLIGVVSLQPGCTERQTKYGPGRVCNAVLKYGDHLIRCGFWREMGAELAKYAVGSKVALHQVNVYYKNNGWQVASTEATQIEECPAELKQVLERNTDLAAAGIALTTVAHTDWNTVKTKPATMSGLSSVIVQNEPRQLEGVFEVHSVAVLGVAGVLNDGGFQMRSCSRCKARVDGDACAACAEPGEIENRWIFSLDLADATGSCNAMLYHDVAVGIPCLVDAGNDEKGKAKIIQGFRASPWSVRLVYKMNDFKGVNYLEIKKMAPTLQADGVVASFRLLPAPQTRRADGCPFAKCSDVSFDRDLGVLSVLGSAVAAARLLVRVLETEAEELVAEPDPSNVGFRVCRRVKCCLADENDDNFYKVKIAGHASSVQWLMTASADSCFLITVKGRGSDNAFTVLAYEDMKKIGAEQYVALVNAHVSHRANVEVTHGIGDTPTKRLAALRDAVPQASTPQHFDKRRKLE